MRGLTEGEDPRGSVVSARGGQEKRARTTVLLLVRLAVAVIVILMCSWAMAIAWAAESKEDGVDFVAGPMITLEMSVQGVLDCSVGAGAAGQAL